MSNLDPKKVWSYNERVWACARIAELEAENVGLKERVAMLDITAVFKSLGEMAHIEELEEAQESEATSCKFCGSNESDRRMNSIVCSGCGRKIGNVAPPEVQA